MMCWFACWEVVVENGKSRGNKGRVDLEALLAGHCSEPLPVGPMHPGA